MSALAGGAEGTMILNSESLVGLSLPGQVEPTHGPPLARLPTAERPTISLPFETLPGPAQPPPASVLPPGRLRPPHLSPHLSATSSGHSACEHVPSLPGSPFLLSPSKPGFRISLLSRCHRHCPLRPPPTPRGHLQTFPLPPPPPRALYPGHSLAMAQVRPARIAHNSQGAELSRASAEDARSRERTLASSALRVQFRAMTHAVFQRSTARLSPSHPQHKPPMTLLHWLFSFPVSLPCSITMLPGIISQVNYTHPNSCCLLSGAPN